MITTLHRQLMLAACLGGFLTATAGTLPVMAQPQAKRDSDLLACRTKLNRINDEANAATMIYVRKLAAQAPHSAWSKDTCDALRISITLSDQRINWQGQENPTCASIFKSADAQQARADFREFNEKKKVLFRSNCR